METIIENYGIILAILAKLAKCHNVFLDLS
jgi:hypothetical protein